MARKPRYVRRPLRVDSLQWRKGLRALARTTRRLTGAPRVLDPPHEPPMLVIIWLYLLNNDFGIINTTVRAWTGIELPNWLVDSRWGMPSIALIVVWQSLGYSMVIFLAGLANIPVSSKKRP